jgi:hypothetical protein
MNIEKEYVITTDDYINFQQYYSKYFDKKRSSYQWIIQWLIIFLPLFYIIFSSDYIDDFTVKMIGLIISLCVLLYYFFMNIFRKYIYIKWLKTKYYKKDVSSKIKIEINENSITEYYNDFEQKIIPKWVDTLLENNDYIYLLNNKNYVIIIPKKYYSNEEIEKIKENYGEKNNIIKIKYGITAHNRTVTVRRLTAARLRIALLPAPNVSYLNTLYAICSEIGWENTIKKEGKKEIMVNKRYCNILFKMVYKEYIFQRILR